MRAFQRASTAGVFVLLCIVVARPSHIMAQEAAIGAADLYAYSKRTLAGTATPADRKKACQAMSKLAPELGGAAARYGAPTAAAGRVGALGNAVAGAFLVPAAQQVARDVGQINDETAGYLAATATGAIDYAALERLQRRSQERMTAAANRPPPQDTTLSQFVSGIASYVGGGVSNVTGYLAEKAKSAVSRFGDNPYEADPCEPEVSASGRWRYIDSDGTADQCETISLDGEGWLEALIKDDLESPQCKAVAKNATPTNANYTIECVYHTPACPTCVDVASANPRSGGTPARTLIIRTHTQAQRIDRDRIAYSWRNSDGASGQGTMSRCP